MKIKQSPDEQIDLLIKLLSAKQQELERNLGELHSRKNDLNLVKMLLDKAEKVENKDKVLSLDIPLLKKIVSDCYDGLNTIYKDLNYNPTRLSGLAGALRIQVNKCSISYDVSIETDITISEELENAGTKNASVYLSCALAIELFCLRGYSELVVTLRWEVGKMEFGIFGIGLERKREQEDLAGLKLEEFKGVLVWASAKMLPETNWKNRITFSIATT